MQIILAKFCHFCSFNPSARYCCPIYSDDKALVCHSAPVLKLLGNFEDNVDRYFKSRMHFYFFLILCRKAFSYGFKLDFTDSSALGADVSGNSNNFTVNTINILVQ